MARDAGASGGIDFAPSLMSNCAHLAPLFLILATLLGAGCTDTEAQKSTARGLVIVGDHNADRPYFHDFGTVPHGKVLSHTYELLNTDPAPVKIRDLIPSCGCTVPALYCITAEGERIEGFARNRGEVLVVPPGGRVFITMKVDTTEVEVPNRDKLSMVRLRSDSANTAFLSFEMHLVVQLLFQATPERIDLGQVAASVGGSAFTEITSGLPEASPMLLDIESSDPEIEVTLVKSVRFGINLWTLAAKLPPNRPLGPYRSEVILRTTDENGEGEAGRLKVDVAAQVVSDVLCDPPTAYLGSFPRAEGKRLEVRARTLVPGHRLQIVGHEIKGEGSEDLEVTYTPVSADASESAAEWIVSLVVPPNSTRQTYSGALTLKLDDPQYPSLRVPFSGRVVTP